MSSWDAETLKSTVEAAGAQRGLKLGKAQAPVRVAVTGRTVGLPLFESLAVLGRERTVERLGAALNRLADGDDAGRGRKVAATVTSAKSRRGSEIVEL